MATLVCAIDDRALATRIASVMDGQVGIDTVVIGTDPWVISKFAASRRIDCFCLSPMSPAELLRIRRALLASPAQSTPVRTALLVEHCDAALVYHALGYGIDDVVDLSLPDAQLRTGLTIFASGVDRACESFVVSAVSVPHPVMHGLIDYADGADRQIVTLISIGYTDREIAEILHYSHQVIRNRVSQIMLRSGIRNRTQLSARHTFESIEGGSRGQPFFTAWTP